MNSRSSIRTLIRQSLCIAGLCIAVVTATTFCGSAGAAESETATSKKSDQLQAPTHRQVRIIVPKIEGTLGRLHTIAGTPDGKIVAGMTNNANSENPGVVALIDSEGETLTQWNLELTPTALAVAPDGTIYAGGSGRIAQLGPSGSIAKMIDSPHIGSVEELKKKAADAIRRSRTQMSATFEKQIEVLKERIEQIEAKEEDERTALENAQWKAFTSQLETIEKMIGPGSEDSEVPDTQLNSAVLRSMNITSMAASKEDLFLCATDPGQGGYSVWRISRDLDPDSSEVIMDGLRGCCGQMDIQCCDDRLLVSENTKFKIGIYDRHGRAQASFGKRDRTSRDGFGSCCNPMNSMAMKDGTILTAESSIGHIKRFDTDGNLVAYIGKASIGGGCKHCALAHDAKNDLYFMMYQDKNGICVLANNDSTPITVAEKELQQREIDFLAKATGQWEMKDAKKASGNNSGIFSVFLSGGSRGSNYPVTSLKLSSDGSAKILAGTYKAYGDKAKLELLPATGEKSDAIAFALAIDQVRFLEGTWTFDNENTATLAFAGMPAVTLERESASESCAGADCRNPDCQDASCPQHPSPPGAAVAEVATTPVQLAWGEQVDAIERMTEEDVAAYEAEMDAYSAEMDAYSEEMNLAATAMSAEAAIPTFEYKLLSKKSLGNEAEAALNELGEQGWEYCGRVGKQMMFKRMGSFIVTERAK